MSGKTLLLWDIDGTLIVSGGGGIRAMENALRAAFAIEGSLADLDYAGRTDRWIFRQVCSRFGLDFSPENFSRLFAAYLEALPVELDRPGARVLPGIREILDRLAQHGGFMHGLLTGNMRQAAEIKLHHHGLWHHFPFGAFADDNEERQGLGPLALQRAREHCGFEFEPRRVWVIGDTPHDIACGRALGARTLAIATGGFSTETLAALDPTAVVPGAEDGEALFQLLSG